MKEKTNRIAEQSKKWLVESLFDLMKDKPYSIITVKEIADNAQLSRRTFYRNFKVKEDLLSQYTSYLFENYISSIKDHNNLTFNDVLIHYFEFWDKHIRELQLLKQHHLFYFMLEKVNLFIPELNTLVKARWHKYDNSFEEEYIGYFSIGGLFNVLSRWIDDTERKSPKEMAKIIKKGIINFSNFL